MISVAFLRDSRGLCCLDISGHAGFADEGSDIVCAGVTSAVQMAANGITQVLHVPAEVDVEDNRIRIRLPRQSDPAAYHMMEALHLQLGILAEQYPQNITITASEV